MYVTACDLEKSFTFDNKSSQSTSHVATPHGREEWTRARCVQLSVQYLLQPSSITQPPIRYIHGFTPHKWTHDDSIYCGYQVAGMGELCWSNAGHTILGDSEI